MKTRTARSIVNLMAVKTNPQCVHLIVDGERRMQLTRIACAELDIHDGDRWTIALERRAMARVAEDALRQRAMRMLGQRDYASAELRAHLVGSGAAASLCDTLIKELNRAGWMDDGRAARQRAAALAQRGWSVARIESALEVAGYITKHIRAALAALETSDRARLAAMIEASGSMSPARLYRRLIAAGFDPDDVESAVDRIKGSLTGS
ncbi:MAG: RecX family transcriptional regulator [Planctomycetota bacterium]|nr:RecX family transcriptional regulator [Planctomycetota bacterium]